MNVSNSKVWKPAVLIVEIHNWDRENGAVCKIKLGLILVSSAYTISFTYTVCIYKLFKYQ